VAAVETGRRYVGYDINEGYLRTARERVLAAHPYALHWTDGSLASASKTALCQYGHEGDTRLQMRHYDRRRTTKITECTGDG